MNQVWRYLKTGLGVVFRHPLTGTSIIPILPDGKIVLVKRRDNGRWSLPGGMVDWGEDIHSSVQRELEEETGLRLVNVRRLVGVYSSPGRDPRFHSICIAIAVEVEGAFMVQDLLEVEEVRAFEPTAIPHGHLSHDHDRQLQDYFAGLTTLA